MATKGEKRNKRSKRWYSSPVDQKGCGWVISAFWKIPQESRGHTSCGFQLHRQKQPPKCRVVYCVSAGRISPHQSCSASAGWASEGSARRASRKLSTAEIMWCFREKRGTCTSVYSQIWAPSVWQTSAENVVLSVFSPICCRACFHPPREQGQSVKASARACLLFLLSCLSNLCPISPESSEVCVPSGYYQVFWKSITADSIKVTENTIWCLITNPWQKTGISQWINLPVD